MMGARSEETGPAWQQLDFEFLAWVVRAGYLMRDDLFRQLTRLGVDDFTAYEFSRSKAAREHNLIALYQDYGMHQPEVFMLFINDCWANYQRISTKAKGRN
ncbi:hypothetical protein AB4Y45_32290 [Paraburkholderia sp. EG287A]|uniref:hypothetical protein n=1 Tax=Paraburkholderia sp. EG287A TaxID=3237012 RepID=UPI0034D23876